ncbi:MAG: hypothetical protein MZW92_68645 [Comamonadaceae bacterium]|nr:hypothetical protein [Comamonadaceae bacterium]
MAGSGGSRSWSTPAWTALEGRFFRGEGAGHAGHLQGVGDDEAAETELLPQDAGHDGRGQGRGQARRRVEGRDGQMGAHDRPDAGVDGLPEG